VTSERAAIVGLISGPVRRSDAERSLEELAGLATTAGAKVVLRVLQERDRPDPGTFLGQAFRCGAAEARAATRDDRDPSLESHACAPT